MTTLSNPTRSARSAFQVCPNGTASNLKEVGKMTQNMALAAMLAAGLCLAAPAAHASLITIALQEASVNGGLITALANDGGSGSVTYAPSVSTYGTFIPRQPHLQTLSCLPPSHNLTPLPSGCCHRRRACPHTV